MGFWPFGQDADIETASRVVTALTKNGVRIRGKVTLHFSDSVTQTAADSAADACATEAERLLREAETHEALIGSEPEVSGRLLARYPSEVATVRSVEIAALHVVGDPALSGQLRRASSGSMQAVRTPTPPGFAALKPSSAPLKPSSAPPPAPMPRRRASSQLRAIRVAPIPPNPTTEQAAGFLGPLAHDAATRLLIGFLRAHDLIGVRQMTVDATTAEMLIPVSEAAAGGYEASRAEELARWQGSLGAGTVAALRREAHLLLCYMTHHAMLRANIAAQTSDAMLDAIAAQNLGDAGARQELLRFPDHLPADFAADVVSNLRRIVRGPEDPVAMSSALGPLVGQIDEDLTIAARVLKQALA